MTKKILELGKVTNDIRSQYFKGWDFKNIRNWLEAVGLDRHLTIQLRSVELLLLTPKGALLQKRPSDKNQFGLWGGVINDDETPEEGLEREIYEELKIKIKAEDCKYVGIDNHYHQYANGDQAEFEAYRYILKLDYVPEVELDEESAGATLVMPILSHQREFIAKALDEYYL